MATEKRPVVSAPQLQNLPRIVIETYNDDTPPSIGRKVECLSAPTVKSSTESDTPRSHELPTETNIQTRKAPVSEKLPPLGLIKPNVKRRMNALVSTCEAVEISDSAISSMRDLIVNANLERKPDKNQLPKLRRTMTFGGSSSTGTNGMSRKLLQKFKSFEDALPSKSFPGPRLAQAGQHVYFRSETPAVVTPMKSQTADKSNRNVVWLKVKFKDMNTSFQGSDQTPKDIASKTLHEVESSRTRSDSALGSEEGSQSEDGDSSVDNESRAGNVSRVALIGSATVRNISSPILSDPKLPEPSQHEERSHWPISSEAKLRTKNITKPPPVRWNRSGQSTTSLFGNKSTKLFSKTTTFSSIERTNTDNRDKTTKQLKSIIKREKSDKLNNNNNNQNITSVSQSIPKTDWNSENKSQPSANNQSAKNVSFSDSLVLTSKKSSSSKKVTFIKENYSKYARRRTPTRKFNHHSKTKMGYLKSKLKKPEPFAVLGEDFEYDKDDVYLE